MNEKQLSIEQVEKIMGWSYPTALKFANRHGEMVAGKWFIPSLQIEQEIAKHQRNVRRMETIFSSLMEPA